MGAGARVANLRTQERCWCRVIRGCSRYRGGIRGHGSTNRVVFLPGRSTWCASRAIGAAPAVGACLEAVLEQGATSAISLKPVLENEGPVRAAPMPRELRKRAKHSGTGGT